MKNNTTTRREQVTVVANTAQDFDRQVNEVLEAASLRGKIVTAIDRRREAGEFVAFIDLEKAERMAATIMDAYENRGECYHCADCPFLLPRADRRSKWHSCDKGMREQTRFQSSACLYFYEALDRGEIEAGVE